MNCQANDLALVVRNTANFPCVSNIIGSPVRLTRLYTIEMFGFGPAWEFAPALRCPNCGGRILWLLDADLQPIRPRGAESETPTEIIHELTA